MQAPLSPREAELTRLIAQGFDIEDMAEQTGMSRHDLEQRLAALEAKLGGRPRPRRAHG